MTQALSPMTPRHVLPVADTRTDTAIRALTNRLEDGPDWRRRAIPDRLAPTEAERELLTRRVAMIDRWLAPSRRAAIDRAVGLVRGGLTVAAGASDDVFDIYAEVLKPFPEPVVEDVCRRFLDGRLGNRVYAPTPAEIAHECRLAVADALAERGRIALILDAEVYGTPSECERARVRDLAAKFAAETGAAARAKAAPSPVEPTGTAARDKAEAQAALRTMEADRQAEIDAALQSGGEPFTGAERTA